MTPEAFELLLVALNGIGATGYLVWRGVKSDSQLTKIEKLGKSTYDLSNGHMSAQLALTRNSMENTYKANRRIYEASQSEADRAAMESSLLAWKEAERLFVKHERDEADVRKERITPQPDAQSEIAARLIPYGSVNLVIIDDNDNDGTLIMEALREGKFPQRIKIFRDGETALEFLCRRGSYHGYPPIQNLQLIILDFGLPKMSGEEVLKAIKGDPTLSVIPLVIFSGSSSPIEMDMAYRLGANSCVQKPTGALEFSEVVKKIVEYFLGVNQLHPLR